MTAPRRYPPTPWISAIEPITNMQHKFQLSHTRIDGKILVTWAKDSPAAPGQERKVLGRREWWEWAKAANRLLATTQWNMTYDPASIYRRPQWNQNKADYRTHADDVLTVVALLPQLLDPKHNPLKKIVQEAKAAAAANGGTNVSHVAARAQRSQEIIDVAQRVQRIVKPLLERMQDARRMKGYTKAEVQSMESVLEIMLKAAVNVERMARTNTFVNLPVLKGVARHGNTSSSNPATFDVDDMGIEPAVTPKREPWTCPLDDEDMSTPRATPVLLDETLPGFDDGGPLSPDEQKIARHIPRVIVGTPVPAAQAGPFVKFYPGTTWETAESLRSQGWNEEDIARSQAAGRARGFVPRSLGFSFEPE